MNLKPIAFAGLLSLFPIEIAYAKPKPLEDELKELAELAMKCGEKTIFDKIITPEGYFVQIGLVEHYSFTVLLNPQPPSNLPFPAKVYFRFQEGPDKAHNHVVDQGDSFEIIGKDVGYFRCFYQHKSDSTGRACTDPFIDDLLEVRLRKAIKFIKENVSPECYGNIV